MAVDQYFTLLRQCVSDCGWTIEALAAEMHLDKGYLWRLLNNEKPWRPEYEIALPNDVEALFAQRRAEAFGRIVVEPAEPEAAAQQLVSGLLGLLAAKLPAKAERMAKIPEPER